MRLIRAKNLKFSVPIKIDWEDAGRNAPIVDLYKRLIALRSQTIARLDRRQESFSVTRDGRLFTLVLRDHRGQDLIACVANFGTEAQAVPDRLRADQWRVIFTTHPCAGEQVASCSTQWLKRLD